VWQEEDGGQRPESAKPARELALFLALALSASERADLTEFLRSL
jgi:hypothetical protein